MPRNGLKQDSFKYVWNLTWSSKFWIIHVFENVISSIEWFCIYISIKFDNLYRKWNFLRISLWKWFYERSPSNIILIKNTKLFFFFFLLGVCIYITYQIKKCVCIYVCIYIIKKKMCVYICVGFVLINILMLQLGFPK